MVELRVPTIVDSRFEAHFRTLLAQSLLRAAEAQYAAHRRAGHALRARRAARLVARIHELQPESGTTAVMPRLGSGLLAATRAAWLACVAVLAWVTLSFGIHSWATGAADLGVVALTFAWFAVSWGSDARR